MGAGRHLEEGVVEVGLEGGEGEGGGLGGEDGFALAEVLAARREEVRRAETGDLVEGEREDEGVDQATAPDVDDGDLEGAEEAEKATGGHAPRGHLFDEGLDGDEALIGLGDRDVQGVDGHGEEGRIGATGLRCRCDARDV